MLTKAVSVAKLQRLAALARLPHGACSPWCSIHCYFDTADSLCTPTSLPSAEKVQSAATRSEALRSHLPSLFGLQGIGEFLSAFFATAVEQVCSLLKCSTFQAVHLFIVARQPCQHRSGVYSSGRVHDNCFTSCGRLRLGSPAVEG